MSKKDCYRTVAHEAQSMLVEKKSKFIANVKPVDNEADALEFLAKMRSKYSDARHNVYAYVIDENNIFRYSDDGEPGGTAGMPVLDTIRKSGLVDVIVVVTRYFGGTLLGTGGLVHAYSSSARDGLLAAKEITREKCNIVDVKVDYTLVGKVQYMLGTDGYTTEDTIYENDVTFKVVCSLDDTENFISKVTELTSGRAVCKLADTKYVDKE
jgi:uncharacterized YigZ family protein